MVTGLTHRRANQGTCGYYLRVNRMDERVHSEGPLGKTSQRTVACDVGLQESDPTKDLGGRIF